MNRDGISFNANDLAYGSHTGLAKDYLPVSNGHVISVPQHQYTCRTKTQHHSDICKRLTTIFEEKNSDYGDSFSETYAQYGMTSVCIRLADKLNRLKTIAAAGEQGRQVKDESVKDTLRDLANYAIMALMELES